MHTYGIARYSDHTNNVHKTPVHVYSIRIMISDVSTELIYWNQISSYRMEKKKKNSNPFDISSPR